jgi:hypothetical protein
VARGLSIPERRAQFGGCLAGGRAIVGRGEQTIHDPSRTGAAGFQVAREVHAAQRAGPRELVRPSEQGVTALPRHVRQ